MQSLVAAVILVSLTLLMIVRDAQDARTFDISGTVADELVRVHEWRVRKADDEDIDGGEVPGAPGYPFDPLLDYRSVVFEADGLRVVMTWPETIESPVDADEASRQAILRRIRGHDERIIHAGTFQPDESGTGGRIGTIDVPDVGVTIPDDVPVLLHIDGRGDIS